MASVAKDTVERETKAFAKIQKNESQLICGVSRKVNIGNFENIDIYCSLSLPIDLVDVGDMQELREVVGAVAKEGYSMVSTETNSRYELIKNLQQPKEAPPSS